MQLLYSATRIPPYEGNTIALLYGDRNGLLYTIELCIPPFVAVKVDGWYEANESYRNCESRSVTSSGYGRLSVFMSSRTGSCSVTILSPWNTCQTISLFINNIHIYNNDNNNNGSTCKHLIWHYTKPTGSYITHTWSLNRCRVWKPLIWTLIAPPFADAGKSHSTFSIFAFKFVSRNVLLYASAVFSKLWHTKLERKYFW